MNLRLAQFISFVFHPLLMPLIGLFLLFELNTYLTYTISDQLKRILYIITFINMFGVPASLAFILYRKGFISSLSMKLRKERIIPFITASFLFLFTYYLFAQVALPQIILSMVLGAAFSVLLSLAVNFVFKVSIHMVGIGGLVGAFLAFGLTYQVDSVPLIALLTILSGLVATSRLSLQAHTPFEVYAGFLLGFVTEFLVVWSKMG